MGLFDTWRRKKTVSPVRAPKSPVTGMPITTEQVSQSEAATPPTSGQDEVVELVADYERLISRREQLQRERGELTIRLDRGEIDADVFRKELMARIQEASRVSERLKEVTTRLTELGYRGVLR
ncbi:MAG: hypothetical protein QXS20_04200 [Candidatus Thorarchaeota archaeon]